jgi:membrane protease YdiL (CAAX protease family)
MIVQASLRNRWEALPVSPRAIITGLLIGLIAANVWQLLLLSLSVPLAATVEVVFLALYVWWASGGGPPKRTHTARHFAFRNVRLSSAQWFWGLLAALSFAATIHASIALLFRFVPFPMEAFRHGYDLSFIPSLPLRWIAVVVSATSAGICEETGFRGYMQRPIEQRHGAPAAISLSSFFFMLLHLTKAWALVGMVPIVFGAGVLLGLIAWSSRSLILCMIGHVAMDIGLFAYWWTGIAGDFTSRPIAETGVDQPFLITCVVLGATLLLVLFAIWQLWRIGESPSVAD